MSYLAVSPAAECRYMTYLCQKKPKQNKTEKHSSVIFQSLRSFSIKDHTSWAGIFVYKMVPFVFLSFAAIPFPTL